MPPRALSHGVAFAFIGSRVRNKYRYGSFDTTDKGFWVLILWSKAISGFDTIDESFRTGSNFATVLKVA